MSKIPSNAPGLISALQDWLEEEGVFGEVIEEFEWSNARGGEVKQGLEG